MRMPDDDARFDTPDDEETFLRMVRYFYEEKGDATRYCFWDEHRFAQLRPVAARALKALDEARALCDTLMENL